MRIGLLTCCWADDDPPRGRLAEIVLRHNGAIRVPGVELVRVAVYSREDKHISPALAVPGWTYQQFPNRPLSDKWDAGAKLLRTKNVDAMMIFGSDDFLNAEYIEAAADALRKGAKYAMPKSLYFFDAKEKKAMYCPVIGRVGGGRALSRNLLDRMHWEPWERGYQRNIDGCMDRRLIDIGHKHPDATIDDIRSLSALILGIKTGGNLHSFDKMRRGLQGEPVDSGALLERYVPEYSEELLNW